MNKFHQSCKEMSVFASRLNMVSGQVEWVPMDDAFDYSQQIARSAYADMLHDTDRNLKYYNALKSAVKRVHDAGQRAIVLDIGTGTGILSMMAANCGADEVYACEFFGPMSRCAEQIIRLNGFDHKIRVIHKGSTQVTVGRDGDMPYRANILVTEVFDTELIGEGAYKTYTHAQKQLMEENAIYIPSVGRVYAAVFESDFVNSYNKLKNLYDFGTSEKSLAVTPCIRNCAGSAAVHDIQLSELPENSFKLITEPNIVFSFDWSGKVPLEKVESKFYEMRAKCTGRMHGVFMWWDLIMDPEGKVILSCAPEWAPTTSDKHAWRDHWMQAVYYFRNNPSIKEKDKFTLVANHDEFSLWFDVDVDSTLKTKYEVPVCECSLHLTSRQRVGMLNDRTRQAKFAQTLKSSITDRTVCLNLSECSPLGLYAALLGAKKVFCYETNRIYKNVLESLAEYNKVEDRIQWIMSSDTVAETIRNSGQKISLILAEPYFSASILPWHNLQFWYIKNQLPRAVLDNARIVPQKAEFCMMAVQFENLWKIRAPVKRVEQFNLQPFDDIIQEAITITDELIDAQPLWEYPCMALSKPHTFLTLNFNNDFSDEDIEACGKFQFETNGICNGIVLWVNWILDASKNTCITTGPTEGIENGKKVIWDKFSKQGVYFVKSTPDVSVDKCLSYSIKFHVVDGYFEYSFVL